MAHVIFSWVSDLDTQLCNTIWEKNKFSGCYLHIYKLSSLSTLHIIAFIFCLHI